MAKCAALDFHVVLGNVDGNGSHRDAVRLLRQEGYNLSVPPTIAYAIEFMRESGNELLNQAATDADECLEDSGYDIVLFERSDIEIIEARVDCLRAQPITRNVRRTHLRTLVEAAYGQNDILVTTWPSLTDISPGDLQDALLSCGVHPIAVEKSSAIVRLFGR
jgi:hypothetical protein